MTPSLITLALMDLLVIPQIRPFRNRCPIGSCFKTPQSPPLHIQDQKTVSVSASEFESKQVECSGCSGDALLLALQEVQIDSWKVNRKSPDGRDWFFDVTISGASREFKVHTL